MTKMRQELVTNFFTKSSTNDKNSRRGSLRIQSFSIEDSPERAVETIRPIRATDETRTTSKTGQANQEDGIRDCASNRMTGSGQVTKRKTSDRTPPGQKLYLGGESRHEHTKNSNWYL